MKDLLRNVALASVIIAALSVTLHNVNRPAQAGLTGSCIAFADGRFVLLDDGRIYVLGSLAWNVYSYQCPIPVAQVATILDANNLVILDVGGNAWQVAGQGGWTNLGPAPCATASVTSPKAVEPSTWSDIKTRLGGSFRSGGR